MTTDCPSPTSLRPTTSGCAGRGFAGAITEALLAEQGHAYQLAAGGAERRLIICAGTGCVAGGALEVFGEFVRAIAAAGMDVVTELAPEAPPLPGFVHVSRSGCQGFCQMGPLATVLPDGILYTRVRKRDVAEIVETTLRKGQPVERLLYLDQQSKQRCRGIADIPFYQAQQRFVLKECGIIDPDQSCPHRRPPPAAGGRSGRGTSVGHGVRGHQLPRAWGTGTPGQTGRPGGTGRHRGRCGCTRQLLPRGL